MEYIGYKLKFTTAVHFGNGKLEDSGDHPMADTVFSALCHEAVAIEKLDALVSSVQEGKIAISDALPYNGDVFYVPKPMMSIETGRDPDSKIKKKAKKMNYIPAEKMQEYISGELDIATESDKLKEMGSSDIRTMASVTYDDETMPFSVGTFRFDENWGLYIIVGYETETEQELIEELFLNMSCTGIGGKRSAGLGKFDLFPAKLPDYITDRLVISNSNADKLMTLSVSMCEEAELDTLVRDSSFLMVKRSGFVSSATYADSLMKKQDFFVFKSGSVFGRSFSGVVKDVSYEGNHPVYRYAKPIFWEVKR